jgi:hypothetical protein
MEAAAATAGDDAHHDARGASNCGRKTGLLNTEEGFEKEGELGVVQRESVTRVASPYEGWW